MEEAARKWIADVVGAAEVRELRSLTFGIVSDLQLVEADGRPLVLRRYLNDELLEELPHVVVDEVVVLREAKLVLGDLVPDLVGSDPTGERVGRPALLMSYLPGEARIHGCNPARMVAPLVRLHSSSVPGSLPKFHHWFHRERIGIPEWTKVPDAWATMCECVEQPEPDSPVAFVHRDYHPGNMLWREDELVGIVDWAFACLGPPATDVAHLRSNLALVDGVHAADAFLAAYRAQMPAYRHDPWWDTAELFTWDSEFAGVMAFNAFGSAFTVELLRARADDYAEAIASSIRTHSLG